MGEYRREFQGDVGQSSTRARVVAREETAAQVASHLIGRARAITPARASAITPGYIDTPGAACAGASTLPPPGERIGPYELIRELGRGGMGAVFLARDTRLGRRVAIKFLHSEQHELTARFLLEARATAQCSHENIVVIHEVGVYAGSPFMVLEYLEGAPLSKLLAGGSKLSPGRAVEIMVPVVRALERAHAHGIVHRDLKPDNIFITDAGAVKVLDFGIAKLLHDPPPEAGVTASAPTRMGSLSDSLLQPELTRRGTIVGTMPYMSPEQWGAGAVDHRTDLWAVGIMLFRMLAGRHPLAPLRGQQLGVTGLLEEPMPSVRPACPDLPDELAAAIDHCLIKAKAQRMGSARELLDALEPLLPGQGARRLRADQSPYAGLSSFQESDADRFFGRCREIAAAVTRLRDQPMLAVVGPSGAGKSSFVRAGVVPWLKRSDEAWSTLVVRPGRLPLAALAHLIAPMVGASSTSLVEDLSAVQAVSERLAREPGFLGAVLRSRARRYKKRILLCVDQLEELYTLVADPDERAAFTACLASVADDATTPLRVILSIRSDFLDRVSEDELFMAEMSRGLFFLNQPSRDGLRDALIQPAEMAGYRFESPGMVEHMLDHLEHTPGALPLLQFAASKLWELRDAGAKRLTTASYEQIGGIAGALASHADAVLSELALHTQPLARALLLRLVTPERTRAIVSMDELRELAHSPADVQRLIDHLVHARLLVVQNGEGAGGASVEIVHESLIHGWPLLSRWLDENQDDAAFLEQLRTAARQWDARGRPAGLLWRGEAMEEARRWRRRYRGELPALQREYLDAVLALAARATRRRRYAVAAIIALLSVLVAAAAVALVLIRDAQKEATAQAQAAQRAESRALHQLAEIQVEQIRRRAAELQAVAARYEVEKASAELDVANDELAHKNQALVSALERANKAKRRARRARRYAQTNEAAARRAAFNARQAEREAQVARDELQILLEREQERVRRLEASGTSVIPDVSLD